MENIDFMEGITRKLSDLCELMKTDCFDPPNAQHI
jgi:hypothetical protein